MKITIKNKIVIMVLALIILSISTLGFLSYQKAKNVIVNKLQNSCLETLENVNDYFLKSFMNSFEYTVDKWSKDSSIINYRNLTGQAKTVSTIPKQFQSTANQWNGYIKSNSDAEWIYFGSQKDGSAFLVPLDPTLPPSYDSRTRIWYKDAVKNDGQVIWTEPYPDAGASREMLVTVAKTVKKGSELVGVVAIDIKLKKLSDIISSINLGNNGYIILLSKDGEVYTHPDKSNLTKNFSNKDWVKEVLKNTAGTMVYKLDGKERVISYVTVNKTGWKIIGVSSIDAAKALTPIRDRTIAVAFISIIITFFIGYKLSMLLTEPINKIMVVIDEVSKGNFNNTANIKTNDEFKILGDNFDNMIKQVRELLYERDKNVTELLKKNKEIAKQRDELNNYSKKTASMNRELHLLVKEIRANYLSTVKALANSIEANDSYTHGHCDRVTMLSICIAKRLGVDEKSLLTLEFAAILHDIGKIGIPSQIINKNSQLTSEEFDIIKSHPKIGYDILSATSFLDESREIILQHHERIDGKGYPLGLKGNEIRYLAKILSIADAYDAMTSSRPYRKTPLTMEEAIMQIQMGKGTQFDSEIADVLIDLLTNSKIAYG